MKRKGTSFIEIVVAITIFLIGILPVAYLTLNSLSAMTKSAEIQEGVKVTATVINYIKSRGYNKVDSIIGADNKFEGKYHIKYDSEEEKAYVVDTSKEDDFEEDFFGKSYYDDGDGALFLIDNLGIKLDGAVIEVSMKKGDLNLNWEGSKELNYINPITNEKSSVIIGDNSDSGDKGIIDEKIIFGRVKINYISMSKPGEEKEDEEQSFVIVPIENYK